MGRDHPEQPKQIGNGGRDLRGWAILVVGVPLIYIGATYTAQPSHRADSTPHPADGTHSWNNELSGDSGPSSAPRQSGIWNLAERRPHDDCSSILLLMLGLPVGP